MTAPRTQNLIEPLTSIRFFAAFAVVLFHSGASFAANSSYFPAFLKTLLMNGYSGVTFFFVLSGFILQFTYRGRVASGAQVRKFAVARFARIYPVYFVAVVMMLPFTTLAGWRDGPQFFLLHWWMPNGAFGWSDWNMPSWTLSVEFFFYLCFPLLSQGIEQLPTKVVAAFAIALLAFVAVTESSTFIIGEMGPFAWMRWVPVPILRLPEFAVGICVAELHLRGAMISVPSWAVALTLIVVLCLTGDPHVGPFVTAMSALLIASVAANQETRFAHLLSMRWIVVLGGASYSLYLLHQPVHFAIKLLLGANKAGIALQYPILIIGSVALFLFYEEPMREWIRARGRMKPSAMEKVATGGRGS
jgi:peptidoglycan/LPS O-acetylase OafA/YrhL